MPKPKPPYALAFRTPSEMSKEFPCKRLTTFLTQGENKQSLTLDINTPKGQDISLKLVTYGLPAR